MIVEYANHLAESGHEVTLHVRTINTLFALSPKLHTHRISYPGKMGCLFYAAMRCFAHDVIIVDIIHLFFPLSLKNNVVYYAQADDREYYDNALLKKTIDVLYARYFSAGRPAISMSRHLTDILGRRYSVKNMLTIDTGIDHLTFYHDPDEDLVQTKDRRRAVVFMARGDHYRKGFDLALEIFLTLGRMVHDRMELWVCGDQLDSDFGFPVRNFGTVSDIRLRKILSSADIFFYPSRHEGFGLFPLEAMACGCAVVTTEAIPYARTTPGIITSRIEDVEDLSRNLALLITDEPLLNQYRKQGREAAGAYDLEKSKIAFVTALTEIVSGRIACA